MPKDTWKFMLDSKNIEVKADIGGKQRVWLDDKLVVDKPRKFGGQTEPPIFDLNGHRAFIYREQGVFKSSLDLFVDGVSITTGQGFRPPKPMPRWGWIFVVACGVMVVFGGAFPAAVGFGSASGVYAIMRNPKYSTTQRLLYSSVITGAAWVFLIMISMLVMSII